MVQTDRTDPTQSLTDLARPEPYDLESEESLRLVYRAVWQDTRANLTESARDEFTNWEGELRERLGSRVGLLHSQTHADQEVSSIEVSLDIGCELGKTRTVLRVLSEKDKGWIWIDAESSVEEDNLDERLKETIQLAASLIDSGNTADGTPRFGDLPLLSRAIAIDPKDEKAIKDLTNNRIFAEVRKTPIVVFAHDPMDGPGPTMARANKAAELLAGVALVLTLPDGALPLFQKEMGIEHDVQPGEARLYMPFKPYTLIRNPVFSAHQVRTNIDETCRRLLSILRPALVATPPPAAFDDLRKAIEARHIEARQERSYGGSSLEEANSQQAEELNEVWDNYLEARKERFIAQRRLNDERSENESLRSELGRSIEATEEKQDQIDWLQDRLVSLLEHTSGEAPTSEAAVDVPASIAAASKSAEDEFSSISEVLLYANENLRYVEIHSDAGQELEKLDRSQHIRVWISDLRSGLWALGAYAHDAATQDYRYKNFQDWCSRSGRPLVWPSNAKKLSMHESEEVKRQPKLKAHRQMPISNEVDQSGIIEMEAHLKLSNGDVAPRLYFYDDTRGKTGMVHVGYVGPHLPTKRFPES